MFHKFFLLSTLFLALTGCAGQGDNSRGLPGWAILLLLVALSGCMADHSRRTDKSRGTRID